MAFSTQPPSTSLPEQLYVMAMSNKIHSRLPESENQQESHSSTLENVLLYQGYSKNYTSCWDHKKTLHHTAFSPRTITIQEGIPNTLLLFNPFPSPRSRAVRSFLLSSLSTTAPMVSAIDVLPPQLELLFVCVGGDVYIASKFVLILGGKAAPYLFMYLLNISGLPATGMTSHPSLLAGGAGRWVSPAVCLLRGYWSVWKGGDTADIGFTSAGFSWHIYATLWFPVELKKSHLKIKKLSRGSIFFAVYSVWTAAAMGKSCTGAMLHNGSFWNLYGLAWKHVPIFIFFTY